MGKNPTGRESCENRGVESGGDLEWYGKRKKIYIPRGIYHASEHENLRADWKKTEELGNGLLGPCAFTGGGSNGVFDEVQYRKEIYFTKGIQEKVNK